MPYVNNQGTRIHYEVEGSGPPLVLHHGFSLDRRSWLVSENWLEALKTDYRLILMDTRGHGDSDKPRDPEAYRLTHKVTTPCLFYMGDKDCGHDYAREICRCMPGATFVSLPGGYADLSLQLVLPNILQFLAKVSQIQA